MKSTFGFLGNFISNKTPVDQTAGRLIRSSGRYSSPPTTMTQALSEMGGSSALFAVVNAIAEGQSAVNWELYRENDEVEKENREVVKIHPAKSVWEKPNNFYTQSEFIEASQQHFELAGEYWWVLDSVTRGGIPIDIWPIRPDLMQPIPHKTKFIAGYYYLGDPSGQKIPLTLDQVIFHKRQNPMTPYRGASPVLSMLHDLDGERAAAVYNAMFFQNGAEPGGLLQYEEPLDDSEFKKIVTRWASQHKGMHNAHRVAVIEGGKWIDRKYTNRDMQFSELRHFSQEVIRRAYRFPKPLLGDVDDVNRANAEAASVMFAEHIIVQRSRRLRDVLNKRFLPRFGKVSNGVEFDFENPTPPNRDDDRYDASAAVERAKILIELGFDAGEVLEHEGLPPLTRVVDTTQMAADNAKAAATSSSSSSEGDKDNDNDNDEDTDTDTDDPKNLLNGHGKINGELVHGTH